jgi:hypothetical protein
MRELTFDGLSPDGARLVLAGKDGQKYTVAIDERLVAAVRRDRARMSQVELEQAGQLRPREIQARIRAGATAEDVAAASGLPLEHVRRFEGPVLTERAWVAQQAQATEVRRPGGDIELGDLVSERLHAAGVDPADLAWDAWRRDDGLWVVIVTFPMPPNTHVATWTYDSGSRTMTVADDNARALSAITSEEPLRLVAARPLLAAVAPVGDADEEPEDSPVAILTPRPWGGAGVADSADDADDALLEGDDGPVDRDDEADEPAEPAEPADDEGTVEALEAELADEREQQALAEAAVVGLHDPDDEVLLDDAGDVDGSDVEDPDALEAAGVDEPGEPEDAEAAIGATADAEDVPLFDAPAPKPAARPGRPAVPSFDDILFGPGPKTQD